MVPPFTSIFRSDGGKHNPQRSRLLTDDQSPLAYRLVVADFARTPLLILLGALLACRSEVREDQRAETRATCAKEGHLNVAASDEALRKLRASACRTKLLFESCEDFWQDVITVCVYDSSEGGHVIDVHANIFVDTDGTRVTRNAICDHVRWEVSASDPAFVYGARGFKLTTCGKGRPKPK